MDVEYLREYCKEKEYIFFIDSADQRLYQMAKSYQYVLKDDFGNFRMENNELVTGIDTMANRKNYVYDYIVTFQEPFENVVSVEVIEAHIPTAPLQEMQARETNESNTLRYVTISCPEIEQHLKRNKSDSDYPFRMSRVEWDTLRDKNFIAYKIPFSKRYFHPIGRMAKLNLRFLKNNLDIPIDFKGAHHTLVLCITCLEPTHSKYTQFVLNPQYQPNQTPDHFSSMHADDEDD